MRAAPRLNFRLETTPSATKHSEESRTRTPALLLLGSRRHRRQSGPEPAFWDTSTRRYARSGDDGRASGTPPREPLSGHYAWSSETARAPSLVMEVRW